MSAIDDLKSELQALQSDLDKIPLAQTQQALNAARERVRMAAAIPLEARALDHTIESNKADSALRDALLAFERDDNAARRARQRMAEIERILGADSIISEVTQTLATLQGHATETQSQIDLVDAAILKLEGMAQATTERMAALSNSSADQLLADVGLPGAETQPPKPAEVAKAQQEAVSITLALEKAHHQRNAHSTALAAINREIKDATQQLREAQSDKATIDHAQALGDYLPFLAAMRHAEILAHGCRINPQIDAEKMAQAMNQATE